MTTTGHVKPRTQAAKAPRRPRRVRLKAEHRRELILAAARGVFQRGGFAAARTREIADAAGITESLIYQHFPSKEQLFNAAVIEPLEHWIANDAHVGPALSVEKSAENQFKLLSEAGALFAQELHRVAPLLGVALFADLERGGDFYRTRMMPLLEAWAEHVRRSFAPGTAGAQIDSKLLARAAFGMGFFLTAETFFRDEPPDFAKIGRDLASISLPWHAPRMA